MATILAALAPVFALIVLGAILKRWGGLPDFTWTAIETLTYRVLLPALLVVKLGGTDLSAYEIGPMTAALAGSTLAVAVALALVRRVAGMEPRGYTSVLQGAIRQNSYIGLAAAGPLFGPAGVALAAVGIAAVIPMVNAMSVWTLTRLHGGGEGGASPNLAQMLWRMITTPIIAACLVGLAINGTGIGLHPLLAEVLSLLGAAALPLGLLAVGAGLEWRAVRRGFGLIALSNTMKLVAVPLGTIAICRWLEADAISTGVALLFAALPSSASSYVLSRQLDGDHELMAAILTTQVLVAAVTIPALLILFA